MGNNIKLKLYYPINNIVILIIMSACLDVDEGYKLDEEIH